MIIKNAKQHRNALFLLFFVQGIALSTWVTRTPAIRDALDASTAQMGLILFGLSIGSTTSVLSAGFLVGRFGTKPVALVGTCCIAAGVPLIGAGATAHWAPLVATGFCCFGLGIGSVEVALNVDGADVEKRGGKPVLAALHGYFSLGTAIGACAGILLTRIDFSVGWHLVSAGVLVGFGVLTAQRFMPSGTGARERTLASNGIQRESIRAMASDSRLVVIGVIVLAMALAEGTANDWLPLLMVDEHGFDASWGSASFAMFAAAMTVGRFGGNRLLAIFSRAAILRASAVSGALGLLVVITANNHTLVAVAVVLWGLGASLGFPVALSAASASGPDGAARVSVVATIGYVAFLAGPPVIGVLGEHNGLRTAMLLPLSLVVLAIFLTPAVRTRTRASSTAAVSRQEVEQ